jgi:hypothetical protein
MVQKAPKEGLFAFPAALLFLACNGSLTEGQAG